MAAPPKRPRAPLFVPCFSPRPFAPPQLTAAPKPLRRPPAAPSRRVSPIWAMSELESHAHPPLAALTTPSAPALPPAPDPEPTPAPRARRRRRAVSVETRRKIAYAMLGQKKSERMKQKVSAKLKGRVPWNKGKKLSPETRARMSEARFGRDAWNKGKHLSGAHRTAIAATCASRTVSVETRRRMRLARRRPGDALVSGSVVPPGTPRRSYSLVESADINDYVTLRRELRIWSDSFVDRNGRRPSLADVRRTAPTPIMRKFEKYVRMRDNIRGLASDVYGTLNPKDVPVVPVGDVSSAPRNNSQTYIRVTKHGNPRLITADDEGEGDGNYANRVGGLEGAKADMWDAYDRPEPVGILNEKEGSIGLIGTHEMGKKKKKDQLSANDYRMIGKYRLMESIDIHRYVALRKEVERWSATFKERNGRVPALSDARTEGKSLRYRRFCEFVDMRDRMSGFVKEVYGTEIDDVETLRKVNAEGKVILNTLRTGASQGKQDCGELGGSSKAFT